MQTIYRNILVVEDEYFIAQDIVEALDGLDAIIEGPAATVGEALHLLAESRPDLVILDINLRGVMSFAVAEQLRSRGIPFFFLTGYESASIPSGLESVPVWRKPFSSRDLASAAAAALASSAPQRPPEDGLSRNTAL